MDTTRTFTGSHRLAWLPPLLTLLVSVLALLALTALVNHGLRWGQRTLDDVRYGVPRRVVVSGVVGHGDRR